MVKSAGDGKMMAKSAGKANDGQLMVVRWLGGAHPNGKWPAKCIIKLVDYR